MPDPDVSTLFRTDPPVFTPATKEPMAAFAESGEGVKILTPETTILPQAGEWDGFAINPMKDYLTSGINSPIMDALKIQGDPVAVLQKEIEVNKYAVALGITYEEAKQNLPMVIEQLYSKPITMQTFAQDFANYLEIGSVYTQRGEIGARMLDLQPGTPEWDKAAKEWAEKDKYIEAIRPPTWEYRKWFEQVALNLANSAPQMVRSFENGLKIALGAAAAVGAATLLKSPAAMSASLGIAAEGGAGAWATIRGVFGGAAAIQSAATVGFATGMGQYNYKQYAGTMFLDLMQRGAEPGTARAVSMLGGAAQMAVEQALGIELPGFAGVKNISSAVRDKITESLFKTGTFSMLLAKIFAGGLSEGGEELAQELTSIVGEEVAAALTSAGFKKDSIPAYVERVKQSYIQGALGGMLLGVVMPSTYIASASDASNFAKIRAYAANTGSSLPEFLKATENTTPEGVSAGAWAIIRTEVFTKEQGMRAAAREITGGARAVAEFSGNLETDFKDAGKYLANKPGVLGDYIVETSKVVNEENLDVESFALGDTEGTTFGTVESVNTENLRTIRDIWIDSSKKEGTAELLRAFFQNDPTRPISWEPDSDIGKQIKEKLSVELPNMFVRSAEEIKKAASDLSGDISKVDAEQKIDLAPYQPRQAQPDLGAQKIEPAKVAPQEPLVGAVSVEETMRRAEAAKQDGQILPDRPAVKDLVVPPNAVLVLREQNMDKALAGGIEVDRVMVDIGGEDFEAYTIGPNDEKLDIKRYHGEQNEVFQRFAADNPGWDIHTDIEAGKKLKPKVKPLHTDPEIKNSSVRRELSDALERQPKFKANPVAVAKAVAVTESLANGLGMELWEFRKVFTRPEMVSTLTSDDHSGQLDVNLKENGIFDFASMVLRLAPTADLTTFVHELTHGVILTAIKTGAPWLSDLESALQVKNHRWTTLNLEEAAYGLEAHIWGGSQGDKGTKGFFAAMREFFAEIWDILKGGIVSPELRAAFDAMLIDNRGKSKGSPSTIELGRVQATMNDAASSLIRKNLLAGDEKAIEESVARSVAALGEAKSTPGSKPTFEEIVEIAPETVPDGPLPETWLDPSTVKPELVDVSKIILKENYFKRAAKGKAWGIVKKIEALVWKKYGVAPIVLWQRIDGTLEIVTGRHRLELRKRLGFKTIMSQVVKESEGFTEQMAKIVDAEDNIQSGQGEVEDYAEYHRNSEGTEQENLDRGNLITEKAKQGFALGRYAEKSLYGRFILPKGHEQKINAKWAAAIAYATKDLSPDMREAIQVRAMADYKTAKTPDELYERTRNRIKMFGKKEAVEGVLVFGDEDEVNFKRGDELSAGISVQRVKIKNTLTALGALRSAAKNGEKITDAETKAFIRGLVDFDASDIEAINLQILNPGLSVKW